MLTVLTRRKGSPALFLTPGSPSAHPIPALVARAQGGITLGPEQGELGADFNNLGDVPAPQKANLSCLHDYYLLPPTITGCLPRLPAASHDYLLPPTATCCLPRLPAASHDCLVAIEPGDRTKL
jgi:hypothetical protein